MSDQIQKQRDAEQARLDSRIAQRQQKADEVGEAPRIGSTSNPKQWGRSLAIWTFNTTNTKMEQSFSGNGIPMLESIDVCGAFQLAERWKLEVNSRDIDGVGTGRWQLEYPNVKRIAFTPAFAAARIGLIRWVYFGPDNQIESKTIGTDAALPASCQNVGW